MLSGRDDGFDGFPVEGTPTKKTVLWLDSSAWLERQPVTLEVTGSIPVRVAKKIYRCRTKHEVKCKATPALKRGKDG